MTGICRYGVDGNGRVSIAARLVCMIIENELYAIGRDSSLLSL